MMKRKFAYLFFLVSVFCFGQQGSTMFFALEDAPTSSERKHSITIDATKVYGTGSHTDIPVLITLNQLDSEVVDGGANSAQADGGDLIFTSDEAGTTRLSCEIVAFTVHATPANRKAQIWVKIPSLSTSTDTTIWVWYKNALREQPASDAAFGSESVWTNYTFATHDCVTDSSGNYTITQNDAAGTLEYLDANVADFNGTTNYHSVDISSVSLVSEFRTFLFSYQLDVSEAAPRLMSMLGGTDTDNMQVCQINGQMVFGSSNTSSVASAKGKYTAALSTGTWYRGAFTTTSDWSTAPTNAYNNGVEFTDSGLSGLSGGTNTNLFAMGAQQDGSDEWDGKLGHLFISSSVLSAGYIQTDEEMISNNATFATSGTPVSDDF